VITPNHFEASALVGFNILCYEDAKKACIILHSKGIKTIIITSLFVKETKDKQVDTFMSHLGKFYVIANPNLTFKISPSGTGDLFSSLFIATLLSNNNILLALKKATESIYGVLMKTLELNKRELQIISAQNEIIYPTNNFKIVEL
jgi:pyridoxine kinase